MEVSKIIRINPKDNVVVALFEIQGGEDILIPGGGLITAREKIPVNHKVSIKDFKKGDPVIKFGEEIGRTNQDIPKGRWIHAHNLVGSDVFEGMIKEVFRGDEVK